LNFAQPDSFIPERWLETEHGGSKLEPHRQEAFMPFSYGSRDCLGRALGWAEMRLILASVLWHFDIENHSPNLKWEDQQVFVMWEMEPMMIKLQPAKR
jgi:cytochrome P450